MRSGMTVNAHALHGLSRSVARLVLRPQQRMVYSPCFFMWMLGIILGVIIIMCLIFGWRSLDNYAPKKRALILSGIVVGIVVLGFLVCFLADILGVIGLYLLCTIAFLRPAFKVK